MVTALPLSFSLFWEGEWPFRTVADAELPGDKEPVFPSFERDHLHASLEFRKGPPSSFSSQILRSALCLPLKPY